MSTNSIIRFPWRGAVVGYRSRVDSHPVDPWQGLSKDLIERFIDVKRLEHSLTRTARRGYRADLMGLDRWMQRTLGRTLVTATSADLRSYVGQRIEGRLERRLLERLLASLAEFYRHIRESGCRDDDPAQRLSSSLAKATRSLLDFAAPLLFRAH